MKYKRTRIILIPLWRNGKKKLKVVIKGTEKEK